MSSSSNSSNSTSSPSSDDQSFHGLPTVVVVGIQPSFGPIAGGTRIMLLVHGLAAFHAGVRVFVNVYVMEQRVHGLGMLTWI